MYSFPVAAIISYQTRWLKTEIHSLTVLDARNLKQRCQHGGLLLETMMENFFHPFFLASGDCWESQHFFDVYVYHCNFSFLHKVFLCFSSVPASLIFYRKPIIGFSGHPNPS